MSEARRILLLRHGQTAWNSERRVQGHLDVALDDVGRQQADRVAPVLAAMAPVLVHSSDLVRARETAECVAQAAGLQVRTDPRLREFDMGELSGVTMAQYADTNPEDHALLAAGEHGVVRGGEDADQLTERFVPALEEAFTALRPGQLGIVVSHGSASRVSLCAWLGLPPGSAGSLGPLGNCHWAVLEESEPQVIGAPVPGARRRLLAYDRHA